MEEEEKKASEWLTINLCDLKVTSFQTGFKSPLNKYNKRNGLGNEIIVFPVGSKMRRSITFYCVLLMPNLWILFLWRIFMQNFEYFCFYLSVSHFICRVPPPLLNLFLSLCVQRFWRKAARSTRHFWGGRRRPWETTTGVLCSATSCSSTSALWPPRPQRRVRSDLKSSLHWTLCLLIERPLTTCR